ncbi:4Fe-4S ferredoxin, nitrogenase-associated [Dehalobacter sp. DCA]|uniref:4Fe-4S dicluster domain-containing protein n=2 Tax=Dehalobacter TaxID=56112 RepID=UPI00028AF1FC|nr:MULTISPECIES: 4Fe-4S dicluster domain-containing protein [unclassified Dehalobacter]AFV03029.1 4Fe-4S ferredoxin, nitrogenase-associated [Dehalobacter sp. DCA]AFV06017.1 4Fe-4S ferredoxin, nitrogenase-associated [Dehalobacter sp. CF]
MPLYQGLNYGGSEWTPQFIKDIDQETCIGCGRCVKVCSQGTLGFGNLNDDEDADRMQSKIDNKNNCIGCMACGKTCVKKAIRFEAKVIKY